jgi:hypothetical protein
MERLARALLMVNALSLSARALTPPLSCEATAEPPGSSKPNEHPIWDAARHDPESVAKVANGERFAAGAADLGPRIAVVHVSGTAFQMGEAHGKLMAAELKEFLPLVEAYLKAAIPAAAVPAIFKAAFARGGVPACLDAVFNLTRSFIPGYFLEEQRGLAAGSGLPEREFQQLSMMGELTKMGCTMLGAWGPATATGGLLQLRALDWDTDGPFQAYPLVLVRHPSTTAEGHAYASVSYPGMVGAITGYSAAGVAISEKVWLHYTGSFTYAGLPTTFLLREILQFDTTLAGAEARAKAAARTNSIFIGVGAKAENAFVGMEYGHDSVTVWTDQTGPNYGNHTRRDGLVYIDKHTQPDQGDGEWCLDALMAQHYGKLTAVDIVREIAALYQTGDAHIAVYDFDRAEMYLAYPSPSGFPTTHAVVKAFDRPYTKLNMTALFSWSA